MSPKPSTAARLTHVGEQGDVQMVDVSAKESTLRSATASGAIQMAAATLEAIRSNTTKKGDVLATARIAAILAAKKTAELIPLCHAIPLDDVQVQVDLDDTLPGIHVRATATTTGRTGVEMEALTAVSVALLTIYDMAKALDRGMTLTAIQLDEKSGGRSGPWHRAL